MNTKRKRAANVLMVLSSTTMFAPASIHAIGPRLKLAGSPSVVQHQYRPGESFDYFFEDTETTYSTEKVGDIPRVKDILQTQELQIHLRLSIVGISGGRVTKKVELQDVRYRELPRDEIARSSQTALRPVQELVPGFPHDFSYTYDVDDGRVVEQLNKFFQPYLGNAVGNFLYYKLLDVHTFQGTINHIPAEAVGQVTISDSRDIPLQHGTFHNHRPMRLYQRVDMLDGFNQAYYKVMTLGNYYDMPGKQLETNYQYAFYVPLEGPFVGLLYQGELQEQVWVHNPKQPPTVMQRQLSMHLQSSRHRTPRQGQ